MPPLGKLEPIPNLHEDLQLLGHYLLSTAENLQTGIEKHRAFLKVIQEDSTDVELGIEEAAKKLGFDRSLADGMKNLVLDADAALASIARRSYQLGNALKMLEQLKKGAYRPCLEFLRGDLKLLEITDYFITENLPGREAEMSQFRERHNARKKAIGEYIATLQKKMEQQ